MTRITRITTAAADYTDYTDPDQVVATRRSGTAGGFAAIHTARSAAAPLMPPHPTPDAARPIRVIREIRGKPRA
jgi:hypothetical protein